MKTTQVIIGALALAISLSSCQNKSSSSGSSQSGTMSSDSTEMGHSDHMDMSTDSTKSGMMGAMNKMMKDMHKMEMSGNADYDLISMLKSHHQGAVAMSKVEVESGTDANLKSIAQRIIDKQSKEIEDLDKLLNKTNKSEKTYDPAKKDSGLGKDMNDNMMKMMQMDHSMSGSVDHEFASMMIKHHQDGIDMGKIILKHSKLPEFKAMAQKMIDDQSKEIDELQKSMGSH